MSHILQDLNEDQQKVVLATHGPVLVLAGAGSGKTRALTHRIAYLLEQGIAQPQEIMAATFTNKAAAEMKQRVADLVRGKTAIPGSIGTFHSLGAKMLRENTYGNRSRSFSILDGSDSERLVRKSMREMGISRSEITPRAIRNRISAAKNNRQTPEDMAAGADSTIDEMAARVFEKYEAGLAKNDAYDFDDLLLKPLTMLESSEEIRRYYQGRWRWISVDEYQDTNMIQEQLITLLLEEE